MRNWLLFSLQAVLVVGIGVVHVYALVNELYWHYLWLDILMHFLGGLWAALAFVWLFVFLKRESGFMRVLLAVVLISVAWEVFEVAIGMTEATNYVVDTSLDLVMDILGGITGFLLAKRMVQSNTNAENQDHSS